MNIVSSYKEDIRHKKPETGGYEWWYFDAIDKEGIYKLVVILYDGNPFSLRYIDAIEKKKNNKDGLADQHPGLSISLYKNDRPIFYDLCELKVSDASFSEHDVDVRLGKNRMTAIVEDEIVTYVLSINEELPSGDILSGSVSFTNHLISDELQLIHEEDLVHKHTWNLVSPRAEVSADLELTTKKEGKSEICFQGNGYHDHNFGLLPLYESFQKWYWGRFHFRNMNLIFYIMEGEHRQQKAWLIDKTGGKLLFTFDNLALEDWSSNFFLLGSHRRLKLSGTSDSDPKVQIDFSKVPDSGPFYKRFAAQAIINIPLQNIIEQSQGIAEYFEPGRLKWKIFWPLVKMRFRYADKPHPVQRSARLYRWTW